MKLRLPLFLILTFFMTLGLASPGCGDGETNQYTLNVEGSITVTSGLTETTTKFIQEKQVFIETTFVQISDRFTDAIGIDFSNFNIKISFPDSELDELELILTPDTSSGGLIYKRDAEGIPFGTSFIDLNTSIRVSGADPSTIALGGLLLQADQTDPNRIPLLDDVPAVGFLFKGENREAKLDELIIILTPTIIQDELE